MCIRDSFPLGSYLKTVDDNMSVGTRTNNLHNLLLSQTFFYKDSNFLVFQMSHLGDSIRVHLIKISMVLLVIFFFLRDTILYMHTEFDDSHCFVKIYSDIRSSSSSSSSSSLSLSTIVYNLLVFHSVKNF